MKVLVLTLAVLQLLTATDIQVVADESGTHVRYRCLVGSMDKQEFAEMAREFLRPEDVTVGVLSVCGSWREYTVSCPRGAAGESYEAARRSFAQYDIERSGCPEVQQAVKFRSGILLRWLDRDCRQGVRILEGTSNILELNVDGHSMELLEFSFGRPLVGGYANDVFSTFFVRTYGPVTVEYAKAVMAHLSGVTGITRLSVVLRSDTWFYNFQGFPPLFPWEGRPKLPTAEEFLRTKEVYCGTLGDDPISCYARRGAPPKGLPGPATGKRN